MSFSNISELPDGLWMTCAQQFRSRGALIAIVIALALFVRSNISHLFAAWTFFTRRYDFIKSNFEKTGSHTFSFNVLQHTVTAVKGASARRAFFDDKSLSFTEGYQILVGAVPSLKDIQIHSENEGNMPLFIKRLAILLRKDRQSDMIPTLFEDVQNRMDSWGKQGTMDPFKNIYDIVFQMTVCMASCRELASDLPTLTEFQRHYWILEKSATPTALLLPWFPGPAKRAKEASTKALFTILTDYIEKRKKAPVPSSDGIDLLLGQGIDNISIISFVLTVIFAGVVNTGINSCWILLYISFHSHWKSAIHTEVSALLAQYTNSSDPLHKRLSAIPISVWEDEMPTVELVLRETIRFVFNFTALRRNLPGGNGNVTLPGGVGEIPSGRFLAYNVSDAHMNASIYTDPQVFDPERFSPDREEDKREPYAFLGWGAGRHPCAGMKIAKLEIKMIVALFVMGYEYDVVNSKGGISERLPVPDYNDIHQARPKGEPCFIKFKRVVE